MSISIHAPRVGSDGVSLGASTLLEISIHAPRVGSDGAGPDLTVVQIKFQSTLPVWGATVAPKSGPYSRIFQSTLPVWGATDAGLTAGPQLIISIHAPRVGSDAEMIAQRTLALRISIHAPRVGSDHRALGVQALKQAISIHAPRVGSDGAGQVRPLCQVISIHAPRVGSDRCGRLLHPAHGISIHAPRVGSDDMTQRVISCRRWISIHAPRVGSDDFPCSWSAARRHFNPRSPCGERPRGCVTFCNHQEFQSTLPVWGATIALLHALPAFLCISIHAPRVGSDGG